MLLALVVGTLWARPAWTGTAAAVPATAPAWTGTAAGAARPPVPGPVRRPFAPPASPYGPGHRGVDLGADPGTPVLAALPGTVTFAGVVAGVGWVTVDHGGDLDTTYGPLEPRRVSKGDRVGAGEVLGALAADATHLDWGARLHGDYIDPLTLLGRWRLRLVSPDAPLPALLGAPADPRIAGPPRPGRGAMPARQPGGGRLAWPARGRVSSGFGLRLHPVTGGRRAHAGIDIAAPTGSSVVAAAPGRVVRAGWAGGYGNLVVLDHGGGLTTRYAHLSRIDVAVGAPVGVGAHLGAVGSTGMSTGPHLHFEVRVGDVAQDPIGWLR